MLRAIACAGRDAMRPRTPADRFGIGAADVTTLVADPSVSLVLNLTAPPDHARVTAAALQAGKHANSEKPLATDAAEADTLIALARDRNRTLACALRPLVERLFRLARLAAQEAPRLPPRRRRRRLRGLALDHALEGNPAAHDAALNLFREMFLACAQPGPEADQP